MAITLSSFPFPCLLVILIGLGIFTVRMRAVSRKQEERTQNFWELEAEANHSPKRDISNLDYIKIPDEIISYCDLEDDEVLRGVKINLEKLKDSNILNLSAYTNTELKKMYGAANLTALCEYDENFILLIRALQTLALELKEKHYEEEACAVLEFAISIKTDISESYKQLGLFYVKEGKSDELGNLKRQAAALSSPMRSKILENLERIG